MAGDDFEIPPPPGDDSPPGSGGSGSGGGSSSGGSSSGGTTSSGGSSSSGSSSESSLTPRQEKLQELRERVDPYDLWYEGLSHREQKSVSILDQIYADVWGEPAPLAVLQAAVKQGLNRWEFSEAMKRNPAWWKSESAEDEAYTFYNFLAQMGISKLPKRRGKGGGGKPNDPPGGDRPGPDFKPGGGGQGDKPGGRNDGRPNPDDGQGPGYLGPPDRRR
jgi:hypothetical protein